MYSISYRLICIMRVLRALVSTLSMYIIIIKAQSPSLKEEGELNPNKHHRSCQKEWNRKHTHKCFSPCHHVSKKSMFESHKNNNHNDNNNR